ncbi:putative odorant receptor [Anopheles darlingi]|uniref:Putative odorant receptor n=1 Tax=Anopheles darlingi TaxID=43151 RepID=W5JQ73_ANODA|nr:putative odorant receptor [Anopheles darlingi]
MADTTPLERFRRTLAWQNRMLAWFGLYVYMGQHRYTYRLVVTLLLCVSFFIFTVYSAIISWGNAAEVMFSVVTVFYDFVGLTRLAILLSYPDDCYRVVQLAEQMYENDDPGTLLLSSGAASHQQHHHRQAKEQVLIRYTDLFQHSVTIFTVCFLSSIALVVMLPFVMYIFTGDMILPLGVWLPYMDPREPVGYWVTLGVQLMYIIAGPLALTPSQNVYFAFIFNICMQYELLTVQLDELDATIERNSSQVPVNAAAKAAGRVLVRDQLVRIIEYQQKCRNYIRIIEKCYANQTFVEFFCSSGQVALMFYEFRRTFWLPGLFVMPAAILQMLIQCGLGTLIEMRCDQFTTKLCAISWLRMERTEQKMYQFVVASAQQPARLTCGGIGVINMNLFLAIYKKVYSFFMMLRNF